MNEMFAKVMSFHARAIACHCECLGMNAENSHAVCMGAKPPYSDEDYMAVMKKWGLIAMDGTPLN